jgi:hypothetical protein
MVIDKSTSMCLLHMRTLKMYFGTSSGKNNIGENNIGENNTLPPTACPHFLQFNEFTDSVNLQCTEADESVGSFKGMQSGGFTK